MASQFLRYVLAAEFALGGQARLTSAITPSINRFVHDKAAAFFRHLTSIPGRNAEQQTQVVGGMMGLAAVLFVIPKRAVGSRLRLGSALLGGSLSTILLVGEATINGDIWLPAINIAFAGYLVYDELK